MGKPLYRLEVEVHKNGTLTVLGTLEKLQDDFVTTGRYLQQADLDSLTYTITKLCDDSVVEGHEDQTVTIAAAIYDTPRTYEDEPLWHDRERPFNFKHRPSSVTSLPFPEAGTEYLLKYTATPNGDDASPFHFEVKATTAKH